MILAIHRDGLNFFMSMFDGTSKNMYPNDLYVSKELMISQLEMNLTKEEDAKGPRIHPGLIHTQISLHVTETRIIQPDHSCIS
jgi:hypothetical protein